MEPQYLVSLGSYYSYLADKFEGVPQADVRIKKFKDGEVSVKFKQSLRGNHIFIFGETVHNLNELLLTIDAARRSSVSEITVVLPYYGYERQDKREGTRGCIGAKVMAHVIESMKIDRVITCDLHAEQIQGYFQVPVEHLAIGLINFKSYLANAQDEHTRAGNKQPICIVSPDAGGVSRAAEIAKLYNLPMATIDKRRGRGGEVESMTLIGDVSGFNAVIVDDMADSCGTMSKAADLLLSNGATTVDGYVTHPVLSGDALTNVHKSKINNLIISDTLFVDWKEQSIVMGKFHSFSSADILKEAILSIVDNKSITHLSAGKVK